MTYRQAAEIIRRKLSGGDIPNDFPIKEQEVILMLSSIVPYLNKKEFYQNYRLDDITQTTVSSTFTADVKVADNEYFITLPSSPIVTGGSYPTVRYVKDRSVEFFFVPSDKLSTYQVVGLNESIDAYIYTYEYNTDCNDGAHRLIFFNLDECVEKLKVTMTSHSVSDYDAEIPIPKDQEFEMLDMAYSWYNPQDKEPQDKTVDTKNNSV